MKKAWSVTTTLRNPNRLVDFLKILKDFDGTDWDEHSQIEYQVKLIQNRFYGYGSSQFYQGLPKEICDQIDDINLELSFDFSMEVFKLKKYTDSAIRGRQSINPLTKYGFASKIGGKVFITELGEKLLNSQIDLGDALLRSFMKWQIPNPISKDFKDDTLYDVKPFIAVILLINKVNQMEKERGNKSKGISNREFALFAQTLINYQHIDSYAKKILDFRDMQEGLSKAERKEKRDSYRYKYAKSFLDIDDDDKIDKFLGNIKDYGDNSIRYFRLTRLFYIRGNGYYIDLEPRRKVEIDAIIDNISAKAMKFDSAEDYTQYLSNYNLPTLPWEKRNKLIEIVNGISKENNKDKKELGIKKDEPIDITNYTDSQLKKYIVELRDVRTELQRRINQKQSQTISQLESYIDGLKGIYNRDDKPIQLEWLLTMGLNALNDAIKIAPNYPVGDDNRPTFTAPAGVPDIECFYTSFNAICEVTMLKSRDQWYNEGQPVMRHLRDFENKNKEFVERTYCLFIAPKIHRDTLNTFWTAIKYEYEGQKQKIIPMRIDQFIRILEAMVIIKKSGNVLQHEQIMNFYDIVIEGVEKNENSTKWLNSIDGILKDWIKNITDKGFA